MRVRAMTYVRMVVCAVALVLGCSKGLDGADLSAAQSRWAEKRPSTYTVTYVRTCQCPDSGVQQKVEVRGSDVLAVNDAALLPGKKPESAFTIDELFSAIDATLQSKGKVRAEFDPELGYPLQVELKQANRHDGDARIEVVAFSVTERR